MKIHVKGVDDSRGTIVSLDLENKMLTVQLTKDKGTAEWTFGDTVISIHNGGYVWIEECLEKRWLRINPDGELVLDSDGREDATCWYIRGIVDTLTDTQGLTGEWKISMKPYEEVPGSWVGDAKHPSGVSVSVLLYLDPKDEEIYPSFKIETHPA